MLVPNNIYELIDDLIERSYTDFTYQLLGKDFLTIEQKTQVEALGLLVGTRPMLELIYLLVRQRSEARYQQDTTLNSLLAGIFATGIISGLPDIARATIDNASHAMDQIITKTKADIKATVKYQITQFNKDEANFARENGVLNITPRVERDTSQTALLLVAIGAALVVAHKAFHRDFTGELTTLVNQAAVDEAFETYGAVAKEVYCIKRVVLDNRTSDHCKRYYLNADGTPTVYKLKDLIANGSNDGRGKFGWLPVCGKDHPRCFTERSTLVLTSKGWKQLYTIKVGDLVLTHTGKYKKVIDTIQAPYGEKASIMIRYNYLGRETTLNVTPDHKFLVSGHWVEAKELTVMDRLTSLFVPCPICGNVIEPSKRNPFSLNKTCSEICNQKWRSKAIEAWHSSLSQEEKDSRAAACSAGTKLLFDAGHKSIFQDPAFHTKERREMSSKRIKENMDKMLLKSSSTRVSRHQRYVFNWITKQYPNKTVRLEHKVNNYYLDVAILEDKIAIEMDGHFHIGREEKDAIRDEVLRSLGWTVLRFGLGGKIPKPSATKPKVLHTINMVLNNHDENFTFGDCQILEIKKTRTSWKTKIYCLSVEDDESFIARGVVSHNCRSQLIIIGNSPILPKDV